MLTWLIELGLLCLDINQDGGSAAATGETAGTAGDGVSQETSEETTTPSPISERTQKHLATLGYKPEEIAALPPLALEVIGKVGQMGTNAIDKLRETEKAIKSKPGARTADGKYAPLPPSLLTADGQLDPAKVENLTTAAAQGNEIISRLKAATEAGALPAEIVDILTDTSMSPFEAGVKLASLKKDETEKSRGDGAEEFMKGLIKQTGLGAGQSTTNGAQPGDASQARGRIPDSEGRVPGVIARAREDFNKANSRP